MRRPDYRVEAWVRGDAEDLENVLEEQISQAITECESLTSIEGLVVLRIYPTSDFV